MIGITAPHGWPGCVKCHAIPNLYGRYHACVHIEFNDSADPNDGLVLTWIQLYPITALSDHSNLFCTWSRALLLSWTSSEVPKLMITRIWFLPRSPQVVDKSFMQPLVVCINNPLERYYTGWAQLMKLLETSNVRKRVYQTGACLLHTVWEIHGVNCVRKRDIVKKAFCSTGYHFLLQTQDQVSRDYESVIRLLDWAGWRVTGRTNEGN